MTVDRIIQDLNDKENDKYTVPKKVYDIKYGHELMIYIDSKKY